MNNRRLEKVMRKKKVIKKVKLGLQHLGHVIPPFFIAFPPQDIYFVYS